MNFQEACEEMKKLAGDRHWCLTYEAASYMDTIQIHGYIKLSLLNGHADVSTTYAGAIENMKKLLSKLEPLPFPADPDPEDGEVVA